MHLCAMFVLLSWFGQADGTVQETIKTQRRLPSVINKEVAGLIPGKIVHIDDENRTLTIQCQPGAVRETKESLRLLDVAAATSRCEIRIVHYKYSEAGILQQEEILNANSRFISGEFTKQSYAIGETDGSHHTFTMDLSLRVNGDSSVTVFWNAAMDQDSPALSLKTFVGRIISRNVVLTTGFTDSKNPEVQTFVKDGNVPKIAALGSSNAWMLELKVTSVSLPVRR